MSIGIKLLIFLGLVTFVTLASAQEKVNLIFPTITNAQSISRTTAYENYTINIYTRAGRYKIVNLDIIKGTRGHIVRDGSWNIPNYIEPDIFEYENKTPKAKRLSKIRAGLAKLPKGAKYMVDPSAAMHNCEVLAQVAAHDICIRRTRIVVKSNFSPFYTGNIYLDHSTYAAPISTAYVLPRVTEVAGILDFDLVAFDSTGRVFAININNKDNGMIKHKTFGVVDLSSIMSPLASKDADNYKPWLNQSYLMGDKPQLKERILTNAETKQMGCYIESITPIYQKVGDTTVTRHLDITFDDNLPTVNGSLNMVKLDIDDNTEKKTAFCLSRGLRMFEDPKTGNNIQCSLNGESHNSYIDSIGVSNTFSKFAPLAFQLTSDDKFRYIHLVYSLVDYNTTNYMFCKRLGSIEQGKDLSANEIMLDWEVNQVTQGCTRTYINNPPDDIVYLQQNKCKLHAAFYGLVYTLSLVDSSLLDQIEEPQVLADIGFQINAAFAMSKSIYFFTGSNKIIKIEYDIADNCRRINLQMDTATEMSSEQYIYDNFLKNYGPLGEPSFIDYREYEEGAQNTNPALMIDTAPPPTLPPPTLVPTPAKSSGSNSKLITIAVGIIIGGLIIAAVIYFLCLRGRDEEVAPKVQSRKSRRSPMISPSSDLMVKTVRSKYQSSTGSGSVIAAKSHKSRAMSPTSSKVTKSAKLSALASKSSKSAKKSKLNAKSKINAKSSKTVTQSPASV